MRTGLLTFHATLKRILESGSDTNWAPDYAEPGYTAEPKGILFANWNEESRYVNGERVVTSRVLARMGKMAEHYGYSVEWSDEWTTCDSCRKAVRTSPDSYSWTRSYWMDEDSGETTCHECVKEDPDAYLEWLNGNERAALTIRGIQLADYGYTKRPESYENGWHPGQTDDPERIAEQLRAEGIEDFIFVIADVGQFDVHFEVWTRAEDTD